jgi:hypothetical protein
MLADASSEISRRLAAQSGQVRVGQRMARTTPARPVARGHGLVAGPVRLGAAAPA